MNPLVSILIVTWNRKTELARSITSALLQTYSNTEIVVVDNGSTDGTREMVREKFPSIRLVCSEKNLGCPSGRNLGFRHCRGKYTYMLDDDGWLKEDAVEISLRRAEEDESIGVVMSRIHEVESDKAQEGDPASRVIRKWPTGKNQPVFQSSFSGGCSIIRRTAIEKVGGFPEDFFRQGEETDLALRLLEAGFFCFLEPASIMYHAPSAIGRNSKHFAFYTLRNTNKTGLRLWPFPWCALRPAVNMVHAVRLMIRLRYPALPLLVLRSLIIDILALPWNRKPVSARTYSLFRFLDKCPCRIKPCTL